MKEELRRHRVIDAPPSPVMLDVDHFQRLTDTMAAPVGDAALVHLVAWSGRRIRDSDAPCRYGGEEFALIPPQTPTQQALEVAEQLRALVAIAPPQHADKVINMTISLGISDAADLATVPEAMIQRADRAPITPNAPGGTRRPVMSREWTRIERAARSAWSFPPFSFS
ncbi:MAG: GGDEF domain-containing protein [Rhodanobacteraceae bacterium]|nr:GGDEF domain-containing protein [Rhodanobacteraceae bacterium]